MKEPKGKCLTVDAGSNVVIMEDLSMYELVFDTKNDCTIARKLLSKATIDFDKWYGNESKANWSNPHFPVEWNGYNLVWDY